MRHRKYHYLSYYIVSIFVLITSCISKDTLSLNGDEKTIILSLSVPRDSSVSRAISKNDESAINTIDILSFDENGNLSYHTQGNPSNMGPSGTATQYFEAKVRHLDRIQTLVVITNARNEVEAFVREYLGNNAPNITKDELFKKLKRVHSDGTKWETTTSPYERFPMWGECEPMVIKNTSSIRIPVLRMVARIDIILSDTIENFTIETISIWNAKREGYIIPDDSTIGFDIEGKIKAIAPSTDENTATHNSRLTYNFLSVKEAIRTIYTFESVAAKTHEKATCLIIGGKYGSDQNATYYRVDFLEPDRLTYKDILRNHCYTVQIKNVTGSGLSTEKEAFDSKSQNLKINILEWDQGVMSSIIFDGQYFLSVNRNGWIFPREERTIESSDNKLEITTDHPDGWIAEYSSIGDWLSLNMNNSASAGTTQTDIILSKNETGQSRTGYITIVAGRLKYIIKIMQTSLADIDIEIVDNSGNPLSELILGSDISATYTFFVRYKPIFREPSNLKLFPITGVDDGTSRFIIVENDTESVPGLKVFEVNATQSLAIGEVVGVKAMVEIAYDDSRLSDNIYIYQKEKYAVFDTPLPEVYGWPYNINKNEISILSNTKWSLIGNKNGLFAGVGIGTPVNGTGNTIYELGANKTLQLNGENEIITLTLTKNEGSGTDIKNLIIQAVQASLNSNALTVDHTVNNSNLPLAELITNLPKSAITAAHITVTSNETWVNNMEIVFRNSNFYLTATYDENLSDFDRDAVITVDFGLEDIQANKLTFTLTQKADPYIYLPDFGWIRRYDDNGEIGGVNNWHYARLSETCPSGSYLPNRSSLQQMKAAFANLPAEQKARYNFYPNNDHYYWSSEGYQTIIPWMQYGYAIRIHDSNMYADGVDANQGHKIRCVKDGSPL